MIGSWEAWKGADQKSVSLKSSLAKSLKGNTVTYYVFTKIWVQKNI